MIKCLMFWIYPYQSNKEYRNNNSSLYTNSDLLYSLSAPQIIVYPEMKWFFGSLVVALIFAALAVFWIYAAIITLLMVAVMFNSASYVLSIYKNDTYLSIELVRFRKIRFQNSYLLDRLKTEQTKKGNLIYLEIGEEGKDGDQTILRMRENLKLVLTNDIKS